MRSELKLAGDGFDPFQVPLYPMLRAQITFDGSIFEGFVDDDPVGRAAELESVRAAIIDTAATIAGRRLGSMRAIRVHGSAPDGASFALVVTATGEVYDVDDDAPPHVRVPPTSASPTSASPASAKPKSMSGRLRNKLGLGSSKPKIQTPDPDGPRRLRPHPLFVVVVGFPLAMVALLAWVIFGPDGDSSTDAGAPGPRQLPVVAPAGYSPVAAWAVPLGEGSSEVGAAADASRVYVTSSDSQIRTYNSDGTVAWTSDLGDSIVAGPTLSTVDGRPAVVVATFSSLVILDPATGAASTFQTEADSVEAVTVRMTATGPVLLGSTNVARIIVGGQLVSRIMPAGAIPVAPGPDGSLIAVTQDRIYASTSDTISGDGSPLQPAQDQPAQDQPAQVQVAGWTGDRLILSYVSPTGGATLVGYAAPGTALGPWSQMWASDPIVASGLDAVDALDAALPLQAAPGGGWGIFGSSAVDLSTGALTPLGEWTTSVVGDDAAFGTNSSTVVTASPSGQISSPGPQASTVPLSAPQAVYGDRAYLISSGGGLEPWLYALVPSGAVTP